MSVHGLNFHSVKEAAKNLVAEWSANVKTVKNSDKSANSPLGRWKVETDNFTKSYSYDHSA